MPDRCEARMSLIALIQDIKARTDLRDYDEASTKQGIVLAILNKLDWDTFSRDEVYPEYPLDEKKLDFALRIREKNKVFIEVKKPAADLEHHEEQLLTYAFKHTVRLAVLTSGLSWWFYLPLKEGPWNERKFFAIDIENQSPEDVTKNFEAFLRKDRVLSGEAVTSAEQLLEGQTRRKRAQETLPRAWREMVNPPDELLVDLISEKVESLCGYKPDESQVVNFLKKLSEPTPRPPKKRVSGREHVGGAPLSGPIKTDKLGPDPKLRFEYWTALNQMIEEKDARLTRLKPGTRSWQSGSIGTGDFLLNTALNYRDKWIRVEIYLDGDKSNEWFNKLQEQKSEIEEKLGYGLKWEPLESRRACRITIAKDADPTNQEDWPLQHEWIIQKRLEFEKVFRPLVRSVVS